MRGALLLAALLALGGCAEEGAFPRPGLPEPALGRRVAVLPFSDSQGRGGEIADSLSRDLASDGWDPIDSVQLGQVVSTLSYQPGEELGPSTLADLRSATLADDVITGTMDSAWTQALLVVSDARTGKVLLRTLVRPVGARFDDAEAVSSRSAQALASWTEDAARPAATLPDPE